jgi:xylulose-5-phosphate/fructose-6-phosphate phosphoketolase
LSAVSLHETTENIRHAPDHWRVSVSSLSDRELQLLDRYWLAANYLSVSQIYLMDNLCCERAAAWAHQAAPPRALGHDAGLNFIFLIRYSSASARVVNARGPH